MVNIIFSRVFSGVLNKLSVFKLSLITLSLMYSANAFSMPSELYQGMVQYELQSGNHFKALTLMNQDYQRDHLVNKIVALNGFNINEDVEQLLEAFHQQEKKNKNTKNSSHNSADYFQIGRMEYQAGRCKPALRAFKKVKRKLSIDDKQEWAFYRANCFILLGSNVRAAQVLNDNLSGPWAAYAYYNLAQSYNGASRDKTKALVALRIADSLISGKTSEEKALSNQINLAAGSMYLNESKPDLASEFFKKIYLDATIAPEALYLNGLSKLELNDFRSATQSWFSVKKYPLINQSVAEALLAIPYAYERSGYTSQALEAYLEATAAFKNELEIIDKIDRLLKKYGAQQLLIEENTIEGLEWFLAKDVVTNTMKATYYSYFMQNSAIYDSVELFSELKMLSDSMQFWSSQLQVFDQSLKKKRNNFSKKSQSFNAETVQAKIKKLSEKVKLIKSKKQVTPKHAERLQLDDMQKSAVFLIQRLEALQAKVSNGKERLKSQLAQSSQLNIKSKQSKSQLNILMAKLNEQITVMIRDQLAELKKQMLTNFERSEQGLDHVFESIAESSHLQKNRLDGRFK